MGATDGIEREMRRLVVAAESFSRKLGGQLAEAPAGFMAPAESGWKLALATHDVDLDCSSFDIPPIRVRPVAAWACLAGLRALPVVQWTVRDAHLTVVQEGEALAIALIPPGDRVAYPDLQRVWLEKWQARREAVRRLREDE